MGLRDRIFSQSMVLGNSTHLPFCFVIEATGDFISRSIQNALYSLLNQMNDDPDLRNMLDISIVTYNDSVSVVQPFTELKNFRNRQINIEIRSTQTPVLCRAVEKAVELINGRKLEYDLQNIHYSLPSIVVFTSGRIEPERDRLLSIMRYENDSRGLNLIPFAFQGNHEFLRMISSNKTVYNILDANINPIFDLFQRSIEKMSQSSSDAYDSIIETEESWETFKQRED